MKNSEPKKFKGWTVPGPPARDPKDHAFHDPSLKAELEAGTVTCDAISGGYRLFQYREGHRFSTDDVLVAAYGTEFCPRAETVLDLGSGIGSVGMMAAWRLASARFTTIEAQDISVRLARESARLNGLEERYEIRQGDLRDREVFKEGEKFDLVLGSPPYFPLGTGVLAEHPQKIACRFETRGAIDAYCLTASERLAPGGWFAAVFPEAQRERVWDAARAAGLVPVRARKIVLREGETPLLFVFAMIRAEDLPEAMRAAPWPKWEDPALTIRSKDGKVHPEYAVFKLSIGFPPGIT